MKVTDATSNYFQASLKGFGEIVQDIADINQCIQIILLTRKGTDPLRPEFGCGVFDYVDKPANKVGDIILAVNDALLKFEPRIDVVKIIPEFIGFDLKVTIKWKFKNISDVTQQTDVIYGIG